MPTAVTLDLDDDAASRIEPLWDALERDPTLPTTRRLGVRPHLSLAVYDALAAQGQRVRLEGFARALDPVTIGFANIGIFVNGAAATIFLGPVADRALLDLHESFHCEFADCLDNCIAHYRPGRWVPHLTLAQDVDLGTLPPAIANLAGVNLAGIVAPVSGRLDVLSVVRYLPVELLGRYALDG